ncbi:hypothetical protein UCDDS831_g02818 [Diplodia seriata]|uniref:Uncharacterized protein n=1 Tax=Diplodia seriata TaxID=420778 RepID=A0A0G2ELY6_9PEZI|nr:hypothetical protein UCDDS831_g02818 [Diplodia seriata]
MSAQPANSMLEHDSHGKLINRSATPVQLTGHAADRHDDTPWTEAGTRWNYRAMAERPRADADQFSRDMTRYQPCLRAIHAADPADHCTIPKTIDRHVTVLSELTRHECMALHMQWLEDLATKHGTLFSHASTAARYIVELVLVDKTGEIDPPALRTPSCQFIWRAELFGAAGYNSARMYRNLVTPNFPLPDEALRGLEKMMVAMLPRTGAHEPRYHPYSHRAQRPIYDYA